MPLVYITCRNEKEAKKICRHLLTKKLIACSNIFPIRSMYFWNGKLQDDYEFLILAKTLKSKYGPIKKEVSKIHSYSVPCILMLDAEANPAFENWAKKEINRT